MFCVKNVVEFCFKRKYFLFADILHNNLMWCVVVFSSHHIAGMAHRRLECLSSSINKRQNTCQSPLTFIFSYEYVRLQACPNHASAMQLIWNSERWDIIRIHTCFRTGTNTFLHAVLVNCNLSHSKHVYVWFNVIPFVQSVPPSWDPCIYLLSITFEVFRKSPILIPSNLEAT